MQEEAEAAIHEEEEKERTARKLKREKEKPKTRFDEVCVLKDSSTFIVQFIIKIIFYSTILYVFLVSVYSNMFKTDKRKGNWMKHKIAYIYSFFY